MNRTSSFNPIHLSPKDVAQSNLAGLKIHVRDGDVIYGASRRPTCAGWIKVYLSGSENLIIHDNEETKAWLHEYNVAIEQND